MSVARVFLASSTGLGVVLAAVLGYETRLETRQTKPSPERSWPMVALEAQAARGTAERANAIRQGIARVASGDRTLERSLYGIVVEVQALDRDDEELRREAERRCGVAVVQSGATWIERR
jgi:hypothetical protein